MIYPPNRKPIVMAIMSRRTEKNAKSDDAMIAEAAKRIFDNFSILKGLDSIGIADCTCQQKLDTKLKKSGIKNESMYKIHQLF